MWLKTLNASIRNIAFTLSQMLNVLEIAAVVAEEARSHVVVQPAVADLIQAREREIPPLVGCGVQNDREPTPVPLVW